MPVWSMVKFTFRSVAEVHSTLVNRLKSGLDLPDKVQMEQVIIFILGSFDSKTDDIVLV
jgi:hypothetical protein